MPTSTSSSFLPPLAAIQEAAREHLSSTCGPLADAVRSCAEHCARLAAQYPGVVIGGVVLTGMVAYYQTYVVCPMKLTCKSGGRYEGFFRSSLPVVKEPYRPTFWCYESRMQTVFANLARWMIPNIEYEREVVTLSDSGEVTLDWRKKTKEEAAVADEDYDGPIVLFLPGLTGHSQSEYIKSLINVAHQQLGARCVVFNFRGRGGHDLKTPRTYSSCNTDDLRVVLKHINAKYPNAPLMAIGVSMGGILLGNYLTREGKAARSNLRAAMLLSTCFDTFKGTESLERPGLNRLLNHHLASCLVDSVRQMRHHFEHKESFSDLERVLSARTIREFDSSFTAPQFGYSSHEEYYADACLAGKLGNIMVPTLALNAEDDPCQPGDSIPLEEIATSDHVAIITTKRGGHIGFMEGTFPTRYCLSDRVFAQFSRGVFQSQDLKRLLANRVERRENEDGAEEEYINF